MTWIGWCGYCGDRTEEGDDPDPRVCAMCAKVPGRVPSETAPRIFCRDRLRRLILKKP